MANWDYVFPLNQEAVEWLDEQGLPHPPLNPSNRMPSTSEIAAAVAESNVLPDDLQVDLDFGDPDRVPEECFKIRGDIAAEIKLLRLLADSCGQLWMYPDTGEIAVIIDCSIEPENVASVWIEASQRDHDWKYFYQRVYAT